MAKQDRKKVLKSTKAVIFDELFARPMNSKMLHVKTGIPRENICRRKRELEDAGILWVLKMDYCPYTGELTQFLTTNPQTYEDWQKARENEQNGEAANELDYLNKGLKHCEPISSGLRSRLYNRVLKRLGFNGVVERKNLNG